jgi:hypothetical protein
LDYRVRCIYFKLTEAQHTTMAHSVARLPLLTNLYIDSSFLFNAAHISTMVSALPALRAFKVYVGLLSSLECFISPHTRTQLRSLSIDGDCQSHHRLSVRAVEALRALRALETLVCHHVVATPMPDAEWVRWRIDNRPGPHYAHEMQPHLHYVSIEDRQSSIDRPRTGGEGGP